MQGRQAGCMQGCKLAAPYFVPSVRLSLPSLRLTCLIPRPALALIIAGPSELPACETHLRLTRLVISIMLSGMLTLALMHTLTPPPPSPFTLHPHSHLRPHPSPHPKPHLRPNPYLRPTPNLHPFTLHQACSRRCGRRRCRLRSPTTLWPCPPSSTSGKQCLRVRVRVRVRLD